MRCTLQKLQEEGRLADVAKIGGAHAIANNFADGDENLDFDATAQAATDAVHALVAALENEHQQVLRLDLNVNVSFGNDMRSLRDSLWRAYTSLSEGSDEDQGSTPSSIPAAKTQVVSMDKLQRSLCRYCRIRRFQAGTRC